MTPPNPLSTGPFASTAGGPPGRRPLFIAAEAADLSLAADAVCGRGSRAALPASPHSSSSAGGTPESVPPETPPPVDPAGMNWPAEESPDPRPDWREKLALGTDLALIGVLVTAAAVPVLTLPAALAAGSTAVRHRYHQGRLPRFRPLLGQFGRGLLPGLPVVLIAALLLVDLMAVSRGWVPGGTPLLVITAAAVAWLAGVATLTLVALGREPGTPWRAAFGWSWNQALANPWSALAPALAGVLAFFLALSVPATIPLVIGFHLFAAHVISDRLAPGPLRTDRGGHHSTA